MRLFKTFSALALVALAFAGCGGGDSDDSTAAATTEAEAPLSKEELISQGDAICAEVNAAVGSVAGSGAEGPDEAAQVSDLYIGMVDSIKALGAPAETAGYRELIVAAEELSMSEAELRLAAERGDVAAMNEAEGRVGPALEEFERVAGEYGFEDCGDEPAAPVAAGTGAAPAEEGEEGGVEVAPEEIEEEAPAEEAPEEAAPETGGAGGGVEEAAPEGGGETGGGSGGVGPG
ncbi:MAG TPA: hypothetical protein VFR04_07155 [Solirubrobacterales bacterium]|nr:hypothetical protein [Solirubrobacterales bacterium]